MYGTPCYAGETARWVQCASVSCKVPDGWKEVAVQQIAMFRHLAELPGARMVGEEEDGEDTDFAEVRR